MERKECSLWCIHKACLASSMKMSTCLLHPFLIPASLGKLLHPLCISGCKIALFLHRSCIHHIYSVSTPCILFMVASTFHYASHACIPCIPITFSIHVQCIQYRDATLAWVVSSFLLMLWVYGHYK